jgi:hypothetical protein
LLVLNQTQASSILPTLIMALYIGFNLDKLLNELTNFVHSSSNSLAFALIVIVKNFYFNEGFSLVRFISRSIYLIPSIDNFSNFDSSKSKKSSLTLSE